MTKKVQIIEVPSEIGAGTRGSSLGIEAIKVAARKRKDPLFSKYKSLKIPHSNHLLDSPVNNPQGKYIDGILEVGERVSEVIKKELEKNHLPIILSGDHSMAYSSIAGIKAANPSKRLGVIWIDAHADLHSPYTSPTGNMHGMPLAMAAAEDNMARRVNEPRKETIEYWEKIKNLLLEGPKYRYEDLVFIGVRSTEEPERHLMDKHDIMNIEVSEIRSEGLQAAIEKTKTKLSNCDMVYVSFDVDSMDPSLSEGTGTPVEDGISHEEAIELNRSFIAWDKVIAWEMVEVNPTLDVENKMGDLAFQVLKEVLEQAEQN